MDLGLRDVGVKNDPRGLASYLGRMSVPVIALAILSVFALCVLVSRTGARAALFVAFPFALTAGVLLLALRMSRRSPIVVVKMTAEGGNQAAWLLIAPHLLLVPAALVAGGGLVIPVVVLTAIMTLLVWRARGGVPEALRRLRPLLASGESVVGDGIACGPVRRCAERRGRDGERHAAVGGMRSAA